MTLEAVLSFAHLVPNGAGDTFNNQVVSQLTSIYQGSPIMRAALDARVASGVPLDFEFVNGLQRNVRTMQGSTLVSDKIQIDPGYCDTILSINQFGVVHQRGFSYMLVHELCHALFGTSDPSLSQINQPGFDFRGSNVQKENVVLQEMGLTDLRVGYFSTFGEYQEHRDWYTGGAVIQYAFKNDEGLAFVDASLSAQKNLNGLLVGGSQSDALTGGNGNDFLWGLDGGDVLAGGIGRDFLIGGHGVDDLRGGSGDDFIFFDAADTIIRGGTGRDAAFAVEPAAVNIKVTNSQIEIVVGGAGNDTIIAGVSPDDQFLAGGNGADTIRLRYGAGEGERVVWGGAGADRFEFVFPTGDANQTWTTPAGILVVNVAGLTALNFASLTLGMLGLGGIDLSKIAAIVVNPDASDQFFVDGVRINAATLAADPNLQPDDGGAVFTTRATGWLGPQLIVQAIFEDRLLATPTPQVNFVELGGPDDDLSIEVNGQTIEEGNWGIVWGGGVEPDLLMTLEEAQDYIDNFDYTPYWIEPTDPRPYGPFFVAGGAFNGSALASSGPFLVTAPPDAISADWLALG